MAAPLGKLHSMESLGLLDGPGIRTVFFLQGCPLRCAYCHNPDSQDLDAGEPLTVEALVAKAKRYQSYYRSSGGGVTLSGGEPLVQAPFVLAAFKALKAEGISTCLDSSGGVCPHILPEILSYTDVILLDVKAFDAFRYKGLTGVSMQSYLRFVAHLAGFKGRVILRHVMVPGISDRWSSMEAFLDFVQDFPCPIFDIQILPYHTDGRMKYEAMGQPYPLEGVPPMDKEKAKALERQLKEAFVQRLGAFH